MELPQIVETSETTTAIYSARQEKNVRLTRGNESFVSFQASPKSKALARDRNETEGGVGGRLFYDVDGMQVGTRSIKFSSVFLASGRQLLRLGLTDIPRQEYGLIAEVDGDCPKRPSGLEMGDEVCLVTIILHCDAFPEDTAAVVHDVYGPELVSSSCDFAKVTIAWGRNFKADAEVAATVAGLYGMVRPSLTDSSQRIFDQHSILAALLALGQVREAPSIEEVVRPRVNLLFIIFMLLPLTLAISLLILIKRIKTYSDLPAIPTEPWELLIVGAENAQVLPKRPDSHLPFPEVDRNFVFAAFCEADDGSSIGSAAGGNSIQGQREKVIYVIDIKQKDQSLRSWKLSTRPSSIVLPSGIGPQTQLQDSDSSSDDGSNSRQLSTRPSSIVLPSGIGPQTQLQDSDSSSDDGSNSRLSSSNSVGAP